MCNCKMCNWLKGLFVKKCNCEEKGCCEDKKPEETVVPVVPVEPVEEKKEEEVIIPEESKEEVKAE